MYVTSSRIKWRSMKPEETWRNYQINPNHAKSIQTISNYDTKRSFGTKTGALWGWFGHVCHQWSAKPSTASMVRSSHRKMSSNILPGKEVHQFLTICSTLSFNSKTEKPILMSLDASKIIKDIYLQFSTKSIMHLVSQAVWRRWHALCKSN